MQVQDASEACQPGILVAIQEYLCRRFGTDEVMCIRAELPVPYLRTYLSVSLPGESSLSAEARSLHQWFPSLDKRALERLLVEFYGADKKFQIRNDTITDADLSPTGAHSVNGYGRLGYRNQVYGVAFYGDDAGKSDLVIAFIQASWEDQEEHFFLQLERTADGLWSSGGIGFIHEAN